MLGMFELKTRLTQLGTAGRRRGRPTAGRPAARPGRSGASSNGKATSSSSSSASGAAGAGGAAGGAATRGAPGAGGRGGPQAVRRQLLRRALRQRRQAQKMRCVGMVSEWSQVESKDFDKSPYVTIIKDYDSQLCQALMIVAILKMIIVCKGLLFNDNAVRKKL